MGIPVLNANDIETLVEDCKVIGEAQKGGQKIVFPCLINGEKCALKLILLSDESENIDVQKELIIDTVCARATREIEIMGIVNCDHIVKLSNIPLTRIKHNGQDMLMYSEEWIEGHAVDKLIKNSQISLLECVKMCIDITKAISNIWSISVVHRDIKPQNIIRKDDGNYVLLDMGLALDLSDKSLTQYGVVPGTKIYFSPEQLDFMHKRHIDFRSDLFSLGIVVYEALTGTHPFYQLGMSDSELFQKIITESVIPPKRINNLIPEELNTLVCRMLSKQPNGRFRKCEFLLEELEKIMSILGE